MACLTVTVVRAIFLKSPFHWRNLLSFRNQSVMVIAALMLSFCIGFLPVLRICNLNQYEEHCALDKNWSLDSMACMALTLGLGLFAPKVAVVVLYMMIYKVVDQAKKSNRMISLTTLNASGSRNTTSESAEISSRDDRERMTVPWSLLVVLVLNFVSCFPWVVLIGAPEVLYSRKRSEHYLVFDLAYACLLVATAANPLAYLITTRVVRKKTVQCFKNCFTHLLRP